MKFFSFKNSKKPMKWPSSFPHRQYVNGMFRCMLCASRSVVAHRGQRSTAGRDGFPGDECSPMNFISFSVEPAESCRLSIRSNQNAWQVAHTSMATCAPKRPSSVMAVISVLQPGHFIDKHCSWPPGPIEKEVPGNALKCKPSATRRKCRQCGLRGVGTPYPPPICMNIKRKEL